MNNLELLYKSIEYIEEHIKEDIRVKDLAEVSCFSLFHFIRLFGSKTLMSPKDYIVRRKISEATKLLVTTDQSVLMVAIEYGFNSHETFIRAFKRVHGVTPLKLKTNPSRYIMTKPIGMDYLKFIDQHGMMQPKPFEFKNKKLYGYSVLNGDRNPLELNKLIQLFNCSKVYIIEKSINEGVLTFYGSIAENDYFELSIEEDSYALFGTFENIEDLELVYHYIYDVWYPRSGYLISTKDRIILQYDSIKHVYSLLVPIKSNKDQKIQNEVK